MRRKVRLTATLKLNAYGVLSDQVEVGLRGFFLNELPEGADMATSVLEGMVMRAHNRVMAAVSEVLA